MFEHLARHRKIVVTGPHRSGTTIAATMIAHDLAATHGLIREELCWLPDCELTGVDMWLRELDVPVVLQAPFIANLAHQYAHCLIVFMHRPLAEIEASQRRMWGEGGVPCRWDLIDRSERLKYDEFDIEVAAMKYRAWQEQKQRLAHYLELHHADLRAHPLWIDKPFRQNFHVRQTAAA